MLKLKADLPSVVEDQKPLDTGYSDGVLSYHL
jgi:hypothetical protein